MSLPAPEHLVAFTLAATLLTITPGPDTALVLRTAASDCPRRGLLAGVGVVLGLFCWGLIVALGLGALIAASALAYNILRWVGAAYLLYLAVMLWRPQPREPYLYSTDAVPDGGQWLLRGFLTNMLNPKVGVFYISLLPQFIATGSDVATSTITLTAIHALLGLAWFAALVTATRPLISLFRRAAARRWLDRITAIVFVAFALRLATSARST